MPYVVVYQLDGRPLEVKRRLVEGITEVVARTLAVPPAEVAICIAEVARENWAHGGVLAADRAAAEAKAKGRPTDSG
jgi:4-oxalocrotonate tautomerase